MIDRSLAVEIAACGTTCVTGAFQRHASTRVQVISGTMFGGRWAAAGAFPVLYLGRPLASVIVEAYRHLVDDDPDMTGDRVRPRRLMTLEVDVSEILDLRVEEHRERLKLSNEVLRSDPGQYARCNRIGQAAHQLGLHGLIAPAATGLGETLALFESHLPPEEAPMLLSVETWERLPADPRKDRSRSGIGG